MVFLLRFPILAGQGIVQIFQTLDSIQPTSKSHENKCALRTVGSALYMYHLKNTHPYFLHTPCFAYDSLGNTLSNFMEAKLCAKENDLHFATPSMFWVPELRNESFSRSIATLALINISALSSISLNQSISKRIDKIESKCPCPDSCHENPDSLIHKHHDYIRNILQPAYLAQLTQLKRSNISMKHIWRSNPGTIPNGTLPVIPDVSIHYRCGDNVVGHYGFLPFGFFKEKILNTTRFIYVMSESSSRKTRRLQRQKCDMILQALFDFLTIHFPTASVFIMRGDHVLSDMTRFYDTTLQFFFFSFVFLARSYSSLTLYANNLTS